MGLGFDILYTQMFKIEKYLNLLSDRLLGLTVNHPLGIGQGTLYTHTQLRRVMAINSNSIYKENPFLRT